MARIAIALGSNVGDSARYLAQAFDALRDRFAGVRASSIYRSAPMYLADQPDYLNAAAIAKSSWGPRKTFAILKQLEAEIGRVSRERNGPREIDLDLLCYGSLSLDSDGPGIEPLILPHPRILERRFVLEPLLEIAPDLVLPGAGALAPYLVSTDLQAQTVLRFDDAAIPLHRDDA